MMKMTTRVRVFGVSIGMKNGYVALRVNCITLKNFRGEMIIWRMSVKANRWLRNEWVDEKGVNASLRTCWCLRFRVTVVKSCCCNGRGLIDAKTR